MILPQLPRNIEDETKHVPHTSVTFYQWVPDNRAIVKVALCLVIYFLTREANPRMSNYVMPRKTGKSRAL